MFFSWPKRFPHFLRRIAALVTVAALIVCTLGVPLPVKHDKPTAEPYPCMHCPCGCKDAETCWRDCCCYSQEEKLVWARKNGVTPPDFVLAAVKKPSCCGKCEEKRSCCSTSSCSHAPTPNPSSVDEGGGLVAQKSCCCAPKKKPSCCGSRVCGTRPVKRSRSSSLVMFQAMRCQGLMSSLTMLPPVVMPMSVSPSFHMPAMGSVPLRDDLLLPSAVEAPDPPPPQYLA